jgi:hypothetical protein
MQMQSLSVLKIYLSRVFASKKLGKAFRKPEHPADAELLRASEWILTTESSERLRFQISSLMLEDCWRYLTSNPLTHERLHLVTGSITPEGTRVLSRIEKVTFERQNAAYVSANNLETHKRIISLDEDHGHQVLGMFHSHMAKGVNATFPSAIDRNFMERMQKIGCDCLGGIFSLDGFFRFFAIKGFEVDVYGRGVERIYDEPFEIVFKITAETRHNA